MYVKDEYRELAVQTVEELRKNAKYLTELADQIENGETTGHPPLAAIVESLSECETALIEIEWVDA
jgi:hypothetical protein